MTDDERRRWVDESTAQIARAEEELYALQQQIDAGTATPQMRMRFQRLHGRRDLLIRFRRNLELRHYDYVPKVS